MSTHSARDQVEFDFWEFVSCAKCRMPFALDNGSPTVPFWLTECGHVVCNSHLNPDQSCSQCGARDIQLAPLQREMEAPMSQWFQYIPQALDAVAFAAKFQQEALASQLRYFRSRQEQYRLIIDRLKRDISELKKYTSEGYTALGQALPAAYRENDSLRSENEQHRLQLHHHSSEGQYIINGNGKRQIVSVQQQPRTGSSTRSINTPLAPNRLSLRPGQQAPELSVQDRGSSSRPVSNRSLEQYAYKPPENHRLPTPTSTHRQAGPRLSHHTQLLSDSNMMPPPPSRFKPALSLSLSSSNGNTTTQTVRQPANMAHPQTPQHYPVSRASNLTRFNDALNGPYLPPAIPRPTGMPSTSSGQRPSASSSVPQRFFPSLAGTPRTAVSNSVSVRPGQRMPFAPDSQEKR